MPVVVVEDDAALASFISTLLTLSGFDVRQAGTREEVVAQIRRPPIPGLMLLDVVLPDTDGFDILQRVRQHPQLKDVPVIMLTGKATREAVLKGMTGGADGYITKPFEPESLLRAIRTVLGLPEPPPGVAWQMNRRVGVLSPPSRRSASAGRPVRRPGCPARAGPSPRASAPWRSRCAAP